MDNMKKKKIVISKEIIQAGWNYLDSCVLGDKSDEDDFINNLEQFLIPNYTLVIKAILQNKIFSQHFTRTFYYRYLKDLVDKAIGIAQIIYHINNKGIKELQKIFEEVENVVGINIINNSKPNIDIFGVEIINDVSVSLKVENIVGWLTKMGISKLFTGNQLIFHFLCDGRFPYVRRGQTLFGLRPVSPHHFDLINYLNNSRTYFIPLLLIDESESMTSMKKYLEPYLFELEKRFNNSKITIDDHEIKITISYGGDHMNRSYLVSHAGPKNLYSDIYSHVQSVEFGNFSIYIPITLSREFIKQNQSKYGILDIPLIGLEITSVPPDVLHQDIRMILGIAKPTLVAVQLTFNKENKGAHVNRLIEKIYHKSLKLELNTKLYLDGAKTGKDCQKFISKVDLLIQQFPECIRAVLLEIWTQVEIIIKYLFQLYLSKKEIEDYALRSLYLGELLHLVKMQLQLQSDVSSIIIFIGFQYTIH